MQAYYLKFSNKDMNIKTEDGIGTPLPLTDIQQNTRWLKVLIIMIVLLILFIIGIFLYAKHNNWASYPVGLMKDVIEVCKR